MAITKFRLLLLGSAVITLLAAAVFADWYIALPPDTAAHYVGSASCDQCHQGYHRAWLPSDHSLAMQPATEATVLGDFNDASIEHDGMVSRMFRRDGRFYAHTEGPDGKLQDFEIKYTFGVRPLQQYMVEMSRAGIASKDEVGQVQVLRLSWDTEQKKWFYLSPPDVSDKLAPDDPLHWTSYGQNWNHMCAECHSTNLQKNFDLEKLAYHTTFSEISVGCESCHGPGSTHVQLASATSLFWDRHLGTGLPNLKGMDHSEQVKSCAPCHSRRQSVYPGFAAGDKYEDFFVNEVFQPETYYADGQVKDEVYVYGSFIQSKMYAKGIRCTDCHNPHTAKLKHEGNQVCTSCHTHVAAKYDSPAHHQHQAGSTGALCVNCHMPDAPFMDVDFRRDHSLRVPRPDLSVSTQVPNACTGCHLDKEKLPESSRGGLDHYTDWLKARDAGDQAVTDELQRLDQWASDTMRRWYPNSKHFGTPHHATTLHAAWQGDADAIDDLLSLSSDRDASAMVRASALAAIGRFPDSAPHQVAPAIIKALQDRDPMVRLQAVRLLESKQPAVLSALIAPLLDDPARSVRQAASVVASMLSEQHFEPFERKKLDEALEEFRVGQLMHADQANAHMGLALLAERRGHFPAAREAYQDAIRVQPLVAGPRSNLAQLWERAGAADRAKALRQEELALMARDARLAPEIPDTQYRYGLALYLAGQLEEATTYLQRAAELQPNSPEYRLAWALILQRRELIPDAIDVAKTLVERWPDEPQYQALWQELQAAK
jgi:predicted CXXCH cytochrome family protein